MCKHVILNLIFDLITRPEKIKNVTTINIYVKKKSFIKPFA